MLSGNDRLGRRRRCASRSSKGDSTSARRRSTCPAAPLKLSIAYDPTEAEVDLKAGAYIERFDYGILARRLHRAEDVNGLFSLNLELAGTAPSLDTIMRHADGRIDFAVWPIDVPRAASSTCGR